MKDPWEQKDVAERPEYASVRADLLRRLHGHLIGTQDPILQGAVTSPHHRRTMEMLENPELPDAKK
jgi:hypothetical protein